jgi:hypothetical protein
MSGQSDELHKPQETLSTKEQDKIISRLNRHAQLLVEQCTTVSETSQVSPTDASVPSQAYSRVIDPHRLGLIELPFQDDDDSKAPEFRELQIKVS